MPAAHLEVDVVDLPGEAVRRQPLGHGIGIGERAKDPFRRAAENAVKTNGARHGRLLSVGIVLLFPVDRRPARSTSGMGSSLTISHSTSHRARGVRDILTGFFAPDEPESYGRLVCVAIGADGKSLPVADDVGGDLAHDRGKGIAGADGLA